jgi:CheY-like chemotaxis protein/two-component sensor histidine kinase
VDDLLDMSRVTQGKIDLRRERVSLASVIEQAVEAARTLYVKMEHVLIVELPSERIELEADPARLAQVFGNLLNNAAKFTEGKGRIVVRAERAGREAVVRVRDNGIGIEARQIPRLFDMFVQADTSLERSRDGLGIGLTLVKRLVEMHGGRVEVHSEGRGRGSEFVVRLPIALAAGPPPAATPPGVEPTVSRRVLVVDDNSDGAESLALLLKLNGHEVHIAHDGPEALTSVQRLQPDVVLLDIGLPGLNGYEVCRRIRAERWGRDITLIAVTGWGQDEDRRRSREAGFDTHLVKPVEHRRLLQLLASLPAREPSAKDEA